MKSRLFPLLIISIFIIIFIFFYKGLQNTNIYTPETKINNKIPLFNGELFYINKTVNSSDLFKSDKLDRELSEKLFKKTI